MLLRVSLYSGLFNAFLRLLRVGACFREVGSRFHVNGPLYVIEFLPISKLNLGSVKWLVFRRLYVHGLFLVLKRLLILSEVKLLWTLYISLIMFLV